MGDEGHESKQTTVGGGALFTHAFTQEGKTDETRQKQRDDRMRGTPFKCIWRAQASMGGSNEQQCMPGSEHLPAPYPVAWPQFGVLAAGRLAPGQRRSNRLRRPGEVQEHMPLGCC
jgi:hypothetical protein